MLLPLLISLLFFVALLLAFVIFLQPPQEEAGSRLTSHGLHKVVGGVQAAYLLEKSTYFLVALFFALTLLTSYKLQQRAPKQDKKTLEQVANYAEAQAKKARK